MNVLTIPASGSILFDNGTAGGSTNTSLTAATELSYDGTGGIDITSYVPGNTDRFNVRGTSGTLFSVSDALTGTVFSVNDASGLPIIEVNSDEVTDTVAIGEFGTNALFVSAGNVGIGTNTPKYPLHVCSLPGTVVGGTGNALCGNPAYSGIFSGRNNCINGHCQSTIIGGGDNYITLNNYWNIAAYTTIIGGNGHRICGGAQGGATIIGGTSHTLYSYYTYGSTVIGGNSNKQCCSGGYNLLAGGMRNCMTGSYTYQNSIIGGRYNRMTGGYSYDNTIVGGRCGCISAGSRSFLGGGYRNCIKHACAAIAGGTCVTSVSANMLHAQSLFIKTLPTSNPGVPGVLWRGSGDGYGSAQLMISV